MTERQAAGPDEMTRRLYARMWQDDDGTWWESLQPQAGGYGMVPWIRGRMTAGEFYWNVHEKRVPSLFRPEYGVAFVTWSSGRDVGPMLRLNEISTHDHLLSDPIHVDYSFSSLACNVVDTSEAVMKSVPELWVPTWAVTPIDAHLFWSWCSEAEETWQWNNELEELPGAEDYDPVNGDLEDYVERNLRAWTCCTDTPDHEGFEHLDDVMAYGAHLCQAIVITECPYKELEDDAPHCEDCCADVMYCTGTWRVVDIVDSQCDCGLTAARNSVRDYIARSTGDVGLLTSETPPGELVTTEFEIYQDTLNYMYGSWLRGWRMCARLAQEDMAAADLDPNFDLLIKESHWFYSCWHRSAPFSDFSGPEQLAAVQLSLLTNFRTLRAS